MLKLSEARKNLAYYLTQPLVKLLARTSITPNTISWLGFLVTLGASMLIVTGHLFAAGFVVLFAGFFDILDGALARTANRVTKFGGVLDSTLDRLAEAAVLLGILVVYAREQAIVGILASGLAFVGSFLVSYVRARAEAIDIDCQVGFFTRTERVILISLGLLLSKFDYALIISLVIIILFSFITVIQRLVYVWQKTKG